MSISKTSPSSRGTKIVPQLRAENVTNSQPGPSLRPGRQLAPPTLTTSVRSSGPFSDEDALYLLRTATVSVQRQASLSMRVMIAWRTNCRLSFAATVSTKA